MTHFIVHLDSGTFFPAEEVKIIHLPDDRPDILEAFADGTDAFRSQMADWFGQPIHTSILRYNTVTGMRYANRSVEPAEEGHS